MKQVTAIQRGNYFTIKDEVDKNIYMFLSIDFKYGIPEILCINSLGDKVILTETFISELEHA